MREKRIQRWRGGWLGWLTVLLLAWAVPALAQIKRPNAPVRVLIQTEFGNLEAELDSQHAPVTTANFLRYVDEGFYTGGRFHRTVKLKPDNQPNNAIKIEVIQGGPSAEKAPLEFPPIALERTQVTGLKHLHGTLSMARASPDSATSDFFICVGAQPELDFGGRRNPDGQGFAAFGRVVKGLDILRKIHQAAADQQALTPPIKIIAIKRLN
jgi:peptidyl-prolyl cis-trans isomerase A (cyclophilin A)